MTGNTVPQHKRQYDWLKPYQWKKGQSGNPAGGKKGKSLKTFVKELLEDMPEEERIEFLKHIDPEMAWKMAEGNPPQQNIIEGGEKPIPLIQINAIPTNNSGQQNTEPK